MSTFTVNTLIILNGLLIVMEYLYTVILLLLVQDLSTSSTTGDGFSSLMPVFVMN